jgi:RNA polymerase sigma-70 factor, ECF subfamily
VAGLQLEAANYVAEFGAFDGEIRVDGQGRRTPPTSEAELMEVSQIAELYERYAPAIYARCRRLLGSSAAGRDALQESFVRVLQRHGSLGPGDQTLRYLYKTATNVCINQLRQRSVRDRAAAEIAAQVNANPARQPGLDDRELVQMLLDHCDEIAIGIAVMHFVDGMTQVEVAKTLGITRLTVYNRIRQIERLAGTLLEDPPILALSAAS